MQMTFSLAHLTVLRCPPPELIYLAARAGYDFASPRIVMTGTPNEIGYDYDLTRDPGLYRETRRALSETGLNIHDIELVRFTDTFDPATLVPTLEIAAELGVRHLLSSVWTPNRGLATERFAELCDLALPYGLNVSLEFVTWANLTNLHEAIEVLRQTNRSNARLAIDLLHAHRSHVTPNDLATVPSEIFGFVHLCDAPAEIPVTVEGLIYTARAERLYVGEGGLDVLGYLNALPAVPYSIEIPNLAREKEFGAAEHAARCLETAKAFFARNSYTGSCRATQPATERAR
jgi:sugar phosphate isomerase/epimerase